MLHILLLILKVFGYIILTLLSILLLAVLIIIFTPLKYEIYAKVDNSIESLAGRVKFGYLFNILNGQVVYKDGRPRYYIAVFKKKIICSKKPRNEHDEHSEKKCKKEDMVPFDKEIKEEDFKYVNKEDENWDVINENELLIAESKDEKDIPYEVKEEHSSSKCNDPVNNKPEHNKRNIKDKFTGLKVKIKNMYIKICDKIRIIKEKQEIVSKFFDDKIHRKAILKAFKEVKILLKKLKPYDLKGRIHYGLDKPDITGKILAVISMIHPYIGNEVKIEPDFNNELVYDGNISFKGRVRISYFITLCIKLAVCRSVWRTVIDGKNIIKDMN